MNYLKNECERILNDLGYEYDENDVKIIAETFDKNYNPDFEEYQIWWNIIDGYYAKKYGED